MSDGDVAATFWEHCAELRTVLIRTLIAIFLGMGISLYYHAEILSLIQTTLPIPQLALFSPQEGFLAVMKLTLWMGILGTSPYWVFGVVQFFKPGLRGRERKLIPGFILLSFLFILWGLTLCFFATLPLANQYLYTFNSSIGLNLWGFSAYVDYLLTLFFAHGIVFELGALLLLLIHLRIISQKALSAKRREAAVAALIIGAVLTPPDVLTQALVALPLYGFYEIAILYGKWRHFT